MAKTKKYRPTPETKTGLKPVMEFPTEPLRPKQPSLEGFSSPGLEEMEAAMEAYKTVEDDVKAQRAELTKELDGAMLKMISVFAKHGQKSIVINGFSGEILSTIKAKVKGSKKLKSEKDGDSVVVGIRMSEGEAADLKRLAGGIRETF